MGGVWTSLPQRISEQLLKNGFIISQNYPIMLKKTTNFDLKYDDYNDNNNNNNKNICLKMITGINLKQFKML